jgi:uncharacterized membrane protein
LVPYKRTRKNSRALKLAGLAVAGIGLSHFTSPQLFDGITKSAFPRNTRQRVYIHGGVETALGLGLSSAKTRSLATVGTIGYVAYLAGNAARNR